MEYRGLKMMNLWQRMLDKMIKFHDFMYRADSDMYKVEGLKYGKNARGYKTKNKKRGKL